MPQWNHNFNVSITLKILGASLLFNLNLNALSLHKLSLFIALPSSIIYPLVGSINYVAKFSTISWTVVAVLLLVCNLDMKWDIASMYRIITALGQYVENCQYGVYEGYSV